MCQMPNIWHICHTKHKNGGLSDVPNSKIYATWLQYRLKYEMVRTDVAKIFIVFYSLFSLLSLHFFLFSSLSPVPSLLPVLSLYSSLKIFDQFGMFTDSDDGVAPTTTTHFADEGLEDSFLETRANLSHPLKPPPPISPSHHQYRSATLDLADLTLRSSSISPSSLSFLSAFHSASLWLWVFFFFF